MSREREMGEDTPGIGHNVSKAWGWARLGDHK